MVESQFVTESSVQPEYSTPLRCPVCHNDHSFELECEHFDECEVRDGTLSCSICGNEFPLRRGVAHLLHNPPDFVERESKGLDRFVETMRNDGWGKERVLQLPDIPDGYWAAQKISMDQLLKEHHFNRGSRLLDIGANTCWASRIFARLGLKVTALDITLPEMQGLHTADWIFEAEPELHFERVLGLMFDMPIASNSQDYVFASQVLHHNDRENLKRTFKEIFRVLKPGGKLIIFNEQMKFPLELKRDHAKEVEQYEGYEHVWFFHQYALDAWRAGLRDFRPLVPYYHHMFSLEYRIAPDTRSLVAIHAAIRQIIRGGRLRRVLLTSYYTLVAGGVSLTMICQKPESEGSKHP